MFRKARLVASLIGAVPSATALSATTLGVVCALGTAGCRDENDPLTFVTDLDDPARSTGAVRRLNQFYEDAMTNDKKDRKGPSVKAFLDKVAEPLTKVCTDNTTLAKQSRTDMLKFLVDSRDPRTAACYAKILNDYKPGETETEVQYVMRSIAASKLEGFDDAKKKEISDGVVKVFSTIKVGDPKASLIYRDVNEALLAIANTSHADALIKLIERPIDDPKNIGVYKNELFWQTVAAQALGNMKSDKAVPALIKVILTPNKADIGNTALVALVRIGKPVIAPAGLLLTSKDEALVKYSFDENMKGVDEKQKAQAEKLAKVAHVSVAAQILGALGREDAIPPLMSALPTADEPTKAVIALQLPNLPKSAETVAAFKDVFEKTKNDTNVPGGGAAKESMIEASAGFYDTTMVSWLVKLAMELKGEQEAVDSIRSKTLETAMKLMTGDQVAEVDALAAQKGMLDGKPSELGKAYEKELKAAKELAGECKSDADCYLKVMSDPKSQDKEGQFKGIKAGYMFAALAGEGGKAKLLDNMNKFTNAAIRFVAVASIDGLSPKGDKAAADKLQKIVDAAEEAKDQEMIQANAPFKQVIARLNARSQ